MLTQSGAAALLALKPTIYELLKNTYGKYCHLWNDRMETLLEEFASSNPLTGDIRDQFNLYDRQTMEVCAALKSVRIDCIEILLDAFFDECIVYAKAWKITLGKHLTTEYRNKLLVFVEFISDMDKILRKTMKDLDDVRLAMDALETIRQKSVT